MPAYGRDEIAMMADDGGELVRLCVENAWLVELSKLEANNKEAIRLERHSQTAHCQFLNSLRPQASALGVHSRLTRHGPGTDLMLPCFIHDFRTAHC